MVTQDLQAHCSLYFWCSWMQFNRANSKEHQCSLTSSYWFLHMCMCPNSICSSFECFVCAWAWMFSVVWNGSSSSRQFIQSDGCLLPFPMWGLMAGLPDLPAMGALSIKELANNSGSPWMSQAPNLYLAMQLLIGNLSLCTWSMAVQDTDHLTDARRWKELLCHKALIYCLKPNPKNIHVTKNKRSKG